MKMDNQEVFDEIRKSTFILVVLQMLIVVICLAIGYQVGLP